MRRSRLILHIGGKGYGAFNCEINGGESGTSSSHPGDTPSFALTYFKQSGFALAPWSALFLRCPPNIVIGQSASKRWTVKDDRERLGGIFTSVETALRFARREASSLGCKLVIDSNPLELECLKGESRSGVRVMEIKSIVGDGMYTFAIVADAAQWRRYRMRRSTGAVQVFTGAHWQRPRATQVRIRGVIGLSARALRRCHLGDQRDL